MTIVPINFSDVTRAIESMLNDAPTIGQAGVKVKRSDEINESPTAHGWIGIYPDEISCPPRALGMGSGYRNQLIRPFLLVQHNDLTSGADCEERLETLIQKVVGVLLSDTSLKGTVQTIGEFTVRRVKFDKSEGIYMQMARIDFTGEIPVSAM
jgi:hypothetical protein